MKKIEYFGTLKNGMGGKIIFNEFYQDIEELLNKGSVYGFCIGNHLYLNNPDSEYSEEEMEKADYSRLVKIEKVTTNTKREILFNE